MSKFTHWIAHKLGWNTGEVEVFWQDTRLMVGFRCHGCGTLTGVHEILTTRRLVKVAPNVKVSGGGAFPPSA